MAISTPVCRISPTVFLYAGVLKLAVIAPLSGMPRIGHTHVTFTRDICLRIPLRGEAVAGHVANHADSGILSFCSAILGAA
jgi:hypothetical protein